MFQKTKRRPVHARAGAAGMTPDDPPFVRGDVQHGLCRNAAHTWAEARPRHLRGMSGWPHNRPNARIVRVSIFAGNRRTETGQNCNKSGSGEKGSAPARAGSFRQVRGARDAAGCAPLAHHGPMGRGKGAGLQACRRPVQSPRSKHKIRTGNYARSSQMRVFRGVTCSCAGRLRRFSGWGRLLC